MKPKISFIIKSNKSTNCVDATQNATCQFKEFGNRLEELHKNRLVTDDIYNLYSKVYNNEDNLFDITFKCLENQVFKDFETILVHSNPEKLNLNKFEKYKDTINLKIVKPKHTLWKDLGDKYIDFVNNLNSGIIWSDGELLFSTSDCIVFNKYLLNNIWKLYKEFNYCAIPIRKQYSICDKIKYDNSNTTECDYEYPILTNTTYPAGILSKRGGKTNWWWGYGLTFPLNECLDINGFDETFDGAYGYDDVDFAKRMNPISKYIPFGIKDKIYTLRYKSLNKQKIIRDNVMLSTILKLKLKANESRPTREEMDKYKEIFLNNNSEIDINYDKCMKIDTYNMRELRDKRDTDEKRCGKIIM